MASPKSVSQIKSSLLRPALSSHFEVQIPVPTNLRSVLGTNQEKLNLMCSEASLPGSSLATTEIQNSYHGVTERHAYRRVFDEVIDLTFYVDAENYLPIRVFETWMAYITGEQYGPKGSEKEVRSNNYFYRMRYPDGDAGYTATGLTVSKFEKNYKQNITYEFLKSFPRNITAMPVTYNGSDLLRCTVSLTYIRYVVQGISGAQGSAPSENFAIDPTGLSEFNAEKNKVITQEQIDSISFYDENGNFIGDQ